MHDACMGHFVELMTSRERSIAPILEFGWQIPVDLKTNANLDKGRSRPDHKLAPISVSIVRRI